MKPVPSFLALSLTCCASPNDAPASALPRPSGGPLEVACEGLGSVGRFAAPTAWAMVSPEFETYIDALAASPYRTDPAEHRVDDLASFEGDLYVALGDYGLNPGSRYCEALGGACPWEDALGHGIPVFRFEPGADVSTFDHVVREEEVKFRRLGTQLALPGLDPTEGDAAPDCAAEDAVPSCPDEAERPHERFNLGAFRLLEGGELFESQTIEDALHVFDLTAAAGRWYASGSRESENAALSGFAAVWGSHDAVNWTVEYTDLDREGTRRVTALFPLGDLVVGLGYHDGAEVQVRIARVADTWVDLEGIAPTLEGRIWAEPIDRSRALAWSGREAVLVEESEGEVTSSPLHWLPAGGWVVDAWLLCEGSLLVLTRESDDHAVYLTADGHVAQEVARWPVGENPVYALTSWEGDLVFGDALGQLWRSEPAP